MTTPFRLLAACVACLSFSAPSLAEADPAPQAEQEIAHAAMHKAIENEDLAAVKALIKAGTDVNARDNDGETALMAVIQRNEGNMVTYRGDSKERVRHETILVNIVKALIAAGADVNAKLDSGETALHRAVRRADEAMVKLLLNAGADVNARDHKDETALFYAVRYEAFLEERDAPPEEIARLEANTLKIVKALIAAKADVNVKNADGQTPIMQSTFDINRLKALLKAGADVNAMDSKGRTPLMHAVDGWLDEWPQVLLKAKPDVNARDLQDKTALIYAAGNADDDVVKDLLKAGADPNVKDNQGQTALMIASQEGRAENVRPLLSARADVNAKDAQGMTALIFAARWEPKRRGYVNLNDILNVMEALLKAGADVHAKDNEGKTALDWARKDEVRAFLREAGAADPAPQAEQEITPEALQEAIKNEDLEAVNALIKAGVDVNAKLDSGETALHMAVLRADGAMVKLLLKAGADVNARDPDGETALFLAPEDNINDEAWDSVTPEEIARLQANALKIVKALIAAGADVNAKNADGRTPLMRCPHDINRLKALLKAGADVNARDNDGWTPLMYAADSVSEEWLKVLIKAKPDVNARDLQGKTALFYAADGADDDIVKILLKAKADPNVKDNQGQTALMIASQAGWADNVRPLLSARADVNAKDAQGMTALMFAARGWDPNWSTDVELDNILNVMKALLKAGADVNAKDNEGKTALDWARKDEVKALLRKSGAK